jgi:CheY-like chemotaxis protein/signal transduction histidine kinase
LYRINSERSTWIVSLSLPQAAVTFSSNGPHYTVYPCLANTSSCCLTGMPSVTSAERKTDDALRELPNHPDILIEANEIGLVKLENLPAMLDVLRYCNRLALNQFWVDAGPNVTMPPGCSIEANLTCPSRLSDPAPQIAPLDEMIQPCLNIYTQLKTVLPTRAQVSSGYPTVPGDFHWRSYYYTAMTVYEELATHIAETLYSQVMRMEALVHKSSDDTLLSSGIFGFRDLDFTMPSFNLLRSAYTAVMPAVFLLLVCEIAHILCVFAVHHRVTTDIFKVRSHVAASIATGYFADTQEKFAIAGASYSFLNEYTKFVVSYPLQNQAAGQELERRLFNVAPPASLGYALGSSYHTAIRLKAVSLTVQAVLAGSDPAAKALIGTLLSGQMGFAYSSMLNYSMRYFNTEQPGNADCSPGSLPFEAADLFNSCFGPNRPRVTDAVSGVTFGGVLQALQAFETTGALVSDTLEQVTSGILGLARTQGDELHKSSREVITGALITIGVSALALVSSAVVGTVLLRKQRDALVSTNAQRTAELLANVSANNLRAPIDGLQMAVALLKENITSKRSSVFLRQQQQQALLRRSSRSVSPARPISDAYPSEEESLHWSDPHMNSNGAGAILTERHSVWSHFHGGTPRLKTSIAGTPLAVATQRQVTPPDDPAEDDESDLLQSIDDCTQQLRDFSSTLADSAKVLSGNAAAIRPRASVLNLSDFFSRIMVSGRSRLQSLTGVYVGSDIEPDMPLAVGVDELRLRHVIDTLMSEACASLERHLGHPSQPRHATITSLLLRARLLPLLVADGGNLHIPTNGGIRAVPSTAKDQSNQVVLEVHPERRPATRAGSSSSASGGNGTPRVIATAAVPSPSLPATVVRDWAKHVVPVLTLDNPENDSSYLRDIMSSRGAANANGQAAVLVFELVLSLPLAFGMSSSTDFQILDTDAAALHTGKSTGRDANGLSLPVCKAIVAALGGTMWMSHASTEDFSLQFPPVKSNPLILASHSPVLSGRGESPASLTQIDMTGMDVTAAAPPPQPQLTSMTSRMESRAPTKVIGASNDAPEEEDRDEKPVADASPVNSEIALSRVIRRTDTYRQPPIAHGSSLLCRGNSTIAASNSNTADASVNGLKVCIVLPIFEMAATAAAVEATESSRVVEVDPPMMGVRQALTRQTLVYGDEPDAVIQAEILAPMPGRAISRADSTHRLNIVAEAVMPELPGRGMGVRGTYQPGVIISPISRASILQPVPPSTRGAKGAASRLFPREPVIVPVGSEIHVMYIDPIEVTQRLSVRTIIKHCHADVLGCDDAMQAIDLMTHAAAARKPFHVAIMDINLRDRLHIYQFTQARQAFINMPMIAALADDADAEEAFNLGFDDFLRKPINAVLTRQMVHKWVKQPAGADVTS